MIWKLIKSVATDILYFVSFSLLMAGALLADANYEVCRKCILVGGLIVIVLTVLGGYKKYE